MWHFRYVAAEPTYKWRFLGGPPMHSIVAANEGMNSVSYLALATAGPSITTPRAGDYDVAVGFLQPSSVSGEESAFMSLDVGGTGANDIWAAACFAWPPSGSAASRKSRLLALAASTALVAKYRRQGTATVQFMARDMFVQPVRVS